LRRTIRLVWDMFSPRERLQFVGLLALTVFMSIFEVLGVAVILPFLQILSDPGSVAESTLLSTVRDILRLETEREIVIGFGVLAFGVILLSMAVRGVATYVQIQFSLLRAYSIGARLLRGYLDRPYLWFLTQHSADFGQALLDEVDQVIRESVLPAVLLLSNLLVTVMIAGFIFVVEPVVAIVATVLLLAVYGTVYLMFREPLARISRDRFDLNRARFHTIHEATGGIKELKILGLERSVLERFQGPALHFAKLQSQGLLIGKLPRFALEAVSYGGFILLVLVIFLRGGGDITQALPLLGLIGMAGTKLFPALQQIYVNLSLLRLSTTSLEQLHQRLMSNPEPPEAPPQVAPFPKFAHIRFEGIHFRYPGTGRPSLQDFTAEIVAQTTVGIVGGTGAGKTTLVDLLLGLLEPDEGQLQVDAIPIHGETVRSWQRKIGYVPQQIFLSDSTIAANIAFGVSPEQIDRAAVERAARIANLHGFVETELPQGYDTEVGERGVRLSGGQRQRIGIARALYRDPDVLVFDEATSALDNLTERAVMEAVNNLGRQKTIIMIAHRLSTVRNCDKIFLLEKGRLVAEGTYDELVATNESFRRMAQG